MNTAGCSFLFEDVINKWDLKENLHTLIILILTVFLTFGQRVSTQLFFENNYELGWACSIINELKVDQLFNPVRLDFDKSFIHSASLTRLLKNDILNKGVNLGFDGKKATEEHFGHPDASKELVNLYRILAIDSTQKIDNFVYKKSIEAENNLTIIDTIMFCKTFRFTDSMWMSNIVQEANYTYSCDKNEYIKETMAGRDQEDQTAAYIQRIEKVLQQKNIEDFFIVKHIQYGVSRLQNIESYDFCNKDQVYFKMYVFWEENQDYWLKVFDNCGGFIPIKLSQSYFWKFYLQNFEKIKAEEVATYKIKPDVKLTENTHYYSSSQTHSPLRYFWFYKGAVKFEKFIDTYDLTTKKSVPNINYKSNKNLALTQLNRICEAIISKYDHTKGMKREE